MSDELEPSTRRIFPAPGAGSAFVAPVDPAAVYEGEVLTLCSPCVAGLHDSCAGRTGGECDCTEGACRGEWVSIGFTTPGHGEVFVAPAGTPPPGVSIGGPTFAILESHIDADGVKVIDKVAPYGDRGPEWDEAPVGPPIPVHRVENRENGRYVEVSIGPAHPAYAALRAGLTDSLSIGDEPVQKSADNGPYVKLDPVPGEVSGPPSAVSVASPSVNDEQVRVPVNTIESLQEVLRELATPKAPPRPNRATRRALDKAAGRLGKRRRG